MATVTVKRVLQAIKQYMGIDGTGEDDDSELTIEEAMTYPPVFNAATRITGAFQTMALELLRRNDGGREVQKNNPLNDLVSWQPNTLQTAGDWKAMMVLHRLFYGNGRSVILKSDDVATELLPLDPLRVKSKLIRYRKDGQTVVEKFHWVKIKKDDSLAIYVELDDNEEAWFPIPDSEVWHLLGVSVDGVEGVGILDVGSRSIGLGIGAEKLIQRQNKKGFGGGLFFKAPIGMFRDEGAAKEWIKKVKEQLAGADGDAIALLRENMEVQNLTMNNSDAQLVEQRRFQREEAALLFALESILGDSSNASYASEVQKWIGYKTNCLAPIMSAFEAQCNVKLLTAKQRRAGYQFAFDDRIFMRMDPAALMSFCSQGITNRILNPNECRDLFDYNPYEGGDEYANPAIDKKQTGGASNQPNNAVAAVLGNWITREQNAVTACVKSPQFITKVEEFYARWEPKLADAIEQLGGDRQLATDHCIESKRRLLEACECQPEELAGKVGACVESWPNRVHQLIEDLQLCLK